MFEHSIPVPRLYRSAAKIAANISNNEGSLKHLVYQTKHPNTKAIYALVAETFKRNKELEFLLKRSKLLENEPRFNPWLARVLITELLWRKKKLAGECKPVKIILAYQQILNANVVDLHNKTYLEVDKASKPRFVRVNTILISVSDAVDSFRNEGWRLVHQKDAKDYDGFLENIASLAEDQFMVDIHIPELLIFPPNTEFHAHQAYRDGLILLQDKASCLPAHILKAEPGSIVLDMCAAPGMKTSHLAAKLNNNGKLYAVDLDGKRLKTLEDLMQKIGVTCVETINKDILQINNHCKDVEYILVDPSCSGSGIVGRLDLIEPTGKDEKRIQRLRGFQIMILKHALRRFPKAKKVVYSTCSIYPEENEEVVQEVITQIRNYTLIDASSVLKGPWVNFGSDKYGDIGKFCLYSKPEKDMCNGFFIAVFERLKDGEENKYLVSNPYLENTESEQHVSKRTKERKNSESIPDTEIRIETKHKNKKNKKKRKKCANIEDQLSNEQTVNINQEESKQNGHNMENLDKSDSSKDKKSQDGFPDDENRIQKKKKKKKNKTELETDNYEQDKQLQSTDNCNDYEICTKKDKKKKKNETINDLNKENVDQQIEHSDEVWAKELKKLKTDNCEQDKQLQSTNNFNDYEIYMKKDKKKKKNKTINDINENSVDQQTEHSDKIYTKEIKKNKKMKKNDDLIEKDVGQIISENHNDCNELYTNKAKKKKKRQPDADLPEENVDQPIIKSQKDCALEDSCIKAKKKKREHSGDSTLITEDSDLYSTRKKKKKSTIDLDINERDLELMLQDEHTRKSKKEKKKHQHSLNAESIH